MKKVRMSKNKAEAGQMLSETFSMLDKMVKRNIIHKNKASNLKSSLTKHVNSLS